MYIPCTIMFTSFSATCFSSLLRRCPLEGSSCYPRLFVVFRDHDAGTCFVSFLHYYYYFFFLFSHSPFVASFRHSCCDTLCLVSSSGADSYLWSNSSSVTCFFLFPCRVLQVLHSPRAFPQTFLLLLNSVPFSFQSLQRVSLPICLPSVITCFSSFLPSCTPVPSFFMYYKSYNPFESFLLPPNSGSSLLQIPRRPCLSFSSLLNYILASLFSLFVASLSLH